MRQPPYYLAVGATRNEEEDIIPVRQTLVITGYLGCIGISVFAVVLVIMATPAAEEEKSKYISEGMEAHCGWSVMVLGSCSFLIFICQFAAGVHMNRHCAILFSMMQLLGWNVVLGVVDTGWNLHYMGLCAFLLGNIGYHWIASRDPNYGNEGYQWVNRLTIFFTCVFCCTAGSNILLAEKMGSTSQRELKAVAVSLEFVLLRSQL